MQEEYDNVYDAKEKEKIKCNHCDLRDERWKINEHEEELCPQKEVNCINNIYGCPRRLKRAELAMHLRICPAMNVTCSHFWRRNQVSALDFAPGKLVPKQSVLDSNLDLSAALFDQHNVFSNILPLRFFEKQKFQPKFVKIRNEFKLLAKAVVDAAIEAAISTLSFPEEKSGKFVNGVSLSGLDTDINLFDVDSSDEDDAISRSSSRTYRSSTSAKSSSRSSRKSGNAWDDATVRQMFRRYLCNSSKNPSEIKEQLNVIKNELQLLLLESDSTKNSDTDSDSDSGEITGWQPPSTIRYHKGDRYGLRQYIQVEKSESETQCNFGDKVFSSPADVVKALFNQLLPSDQVACSMSSSEDAGWSHGWSCRSSAAQTVEFPELMHLKLQPGALGRPSRKSRLTEPLPYLGLEPSTTSSGFNPASLSAIGPAMIFGCDQSFRCDEISEHLEHVHDGVIPNLHGSIIERCPMHRYGCSFYRNRLVPEKGNLKHDTVKKCWPCPQKVVRNRKSSIGLVDMPAEVLVKIMQNLDSYSLKSLLETNYEFSILVDEIMSQRGMILSQWKKSSTGWSLSFKWTFSNHSKATKWRLSDEPAIGAHLSSCSYLKSAQIQYGKRPLPQIGMARGTQVRDLPFSY